MALSCSAIQEQAKDLVRQVFHVNILDELSKPEALLLCSTHDRFRVNVSLPPIAIHEDSTFEKSVFISANRLLHVDDMKINSSVDLGLLDFPEVRMSLPHVAILPRSCFCVHS